MRLRFSIVSILIVLISPLGAFAQPESRSVTDFNVGIIIPLSGDLAEYGTAIRNGFQMARDEAPEAFSHVHFIYDDSAYDGRMSVAAFEKMRTTQTIDLYYLWGVTPTEALLPIAAARKLPVLVETTMKEAPVGKPLVVRAARTGERIAKALAAELEKRKATTVSLLVTQIPFYTDIANHLEVALRARGITLRRRDEVLPAQEDFRSLLVDRAAREQEYIGAFLLPGQLITFYREVARAKINAKTFGADLLDSRTTVSACPETINGAFFTQVGLTDEFRRKYLKLFNNDIHLGSAAQAYDAAWLVKDLFGALENRLSGEEVITRISQIPPRSGATGAYHYSESPDAGKELRTPVSMKEIRNKTIETITEDTGF